jgi:hypothetical protein
LIVAHRGAFEYDWRTYFHLPLTVVGESMSWGEAVRMTQILTADPGSQVFVALNAWPHPASREWIMLASIRDSSEYGRLGKKATPYPRPWDPAPKVIGRTSLTRERLRHILDTHRAEVTPGG